MIFKISLKEAEEKDFIKHLKREGESKHDSDDIFDKKQLRMGTEVEKEHSSNKEIAKDHLAEIPDYYTRLAKMEKEAFKELKKGKEK